MSENEKRMAGDYEIINSVRIGSKEIVLGINRNDAMPGKYYCGNCECNEILELFTDGVASDSYPAIVEAFAERIADEAREVKKIIEQERLIVGDDCRLSAEDCAYTITSEENILNKVVIVDPKILRPEYQRSSHQLVYVTGGNGAYANARGRKVFTKNLLNGQDNTFYRQDILGVVDTEKLPKWAKDGYERYVTNKERGGR